MTHEEFDMTEWKARMRLRHYKQGEGTIVGVELEERLIEIQFDENLGTDWVRCENIELIKEEAK